MILPTEQRRWRYMKKIHKTLPEILVENFTNERLDEKAFRDKEFRSSDRKLHEALERYGRLSLPKGIDKVVSRVFDAFAEQNAVYVGIAYMQGMKDAVELLKKIGVI